MPHVQNDKKKLFSLFFYILFSLFFKKNFTFFFSFFPIFLFLDFPSVILFAVFFFGAFFHLFFQGLCFNSYETNKYKLLLYYNSYETNKYKSLHYHNSYETNKYVKRNGSKIRTNIKFVFPIIDSLCFVLKRITKALNSFDPTHYLP